MQTTTTRRATLHALALAAALATFGGAALAQDAAPNGAANLRAGKIFTSSNATGGNELLVYTERSDHSLALLTRAGTSGNGTGAGLGSQGAVTLSTDGLYAFVVNAASNTVATFSLAGPQPVLKSVVASGGLMPISVTEHGGKVYVLNAAGEGGVAGYYNVHGQLSPIAGGVRGLSVATGAAPAQVSFSTDGDTLMVTEKGTNHLTTYSVRANGSIGLPVVTASVGLTPFGFAFDKYNHAIVSEAAGGAPGASTVSSYRFTNRNPAQPIAVTKSAATTQAAACWVALTPDSKWAYTTNTASGSVSSFRVKASGTLVLTAAVAASTGEGSAPIDVSTSADGYRLYVLANAGATISSFAIDEAGALTPDGGATDLPVGSIGMASN